MTRKFIGLIVSFSMVGCAAASLKPGAEKIRISNQEPKNCKFLGEISGSQGNAIVGGWTSNENLELGARNEMKNKALDLGANVIQLLTSADGSTIGQYGGSKTSHSLMGNAYLCNE
jgi:hypothetical protein